jgi:hypothetical protein
MAIISCPECSNKVSNKATNCPHCGFLIASKANNGQNKSKLPMIFLGMGIVVIFGITFVVSNINRRSLECNQFKSIQEEKYYLENPNSIKTGAVEQEKTSQILNKLKSMQISDDNLREIYERYVTNYQKLLFLYTSGLETLKKLRGFENEITKGKPKTAETDRLTSQAIEEAISIINQIKFVLEETKLIDLEFAKICSSS